MVRGVKILTRACGVRPITMLCVSWPIRADCARLKEGLCRRGGGDDACMSLQNLCFLPKLSSFMTQSIYSPCRNRVRKHFLPVSMLTDGIAVH